MSTENFDIDYFCQMISDFWGSFRNSEKALEGIRKEFRYLNNKELKELWIFIKSKTDQIKNPTASLIRRIAKEHNFRIRESSVNRVESKYFCGGCGEENELTGWKCTGCGKHFSDLPKKCSACDTEFPENYGYGICKHEYKGKLCGVYRSPGEVRRVVV